MRFEDVLPALRKGKKIRLKGSEDFEYLFKPKNENYLKNEDYHNINLSWEDFFRDDWEIVKDKKKVKLRDLTKNQYIEYCKKCNARICNECPLHRVECNLEYDNCWFKNKDIYNDKFLDQEVEIEVEE